MSRLVAFGCSFTYGHWLSDCQGHTFSPSKFAWPTILSSFLGVECVNQSSPGSSNKRIWNNVINFDFNKNDLVFILWTYPLRTAIIKETEVLDIGHWSNTGPGYFYYKHLYDEYNSILESKVYVDHINYYLKNQSIKVYNLIVERKFSMLKNFKGSENNFLNLYFYEDYADILPKALDNCHPGENAHYKFSQDIFNCIQNG